MKIFRLNTLLALACTVCFSVQPVSPVSAAAAQWTNADAGKIVETYANAVLAQGIEGVSGEFQYLPVTDSGSLTVNNFIDEYSSLQIGITASTQTTEQIRESREDTEKNTQMSGESFGDQTIYIPTQEAAEKYQTVRREDYFKYTSLARAFCGEQEINLSVYVNLSEKLLPQTDYYQDLADRLSRDTLADALAATGLCGSQKDQLQVKIVAINGEVEVRRGEGNFAAAKVGDVLQAGDYLATGFESTASFEVMGMGAVLEVRPMTNFSIAQLFYDGNLARTAINLRLGEVTTNIKPEKGVKASFQIVTPTATIGTRGTVFQVAVAESGATNVFVTEGAVDVISEKTAESIVLDEGEKAYIGTVGKIEVSSMEEDTVLREEALPPQNLVNTVHAVYTDQQTLTWYLLGAVIFLSLLLWVAIYFFIKRKPLLGAAFLIATGMLILAGAIYVTMNPPAATPPAIVDTVPEEPMSEIDRDMQPDAAVAEDRSTAEQPVEETVEGTAEAADEAESVIATDQDIKSPPDLAFAINLAPFNDKIDFLIEQNDWSEASYPACYKLDGLLSDDFFAGGICPAGSIEVFRISLYSPDQILEMKESPFYEGTYLELYEFADSGAYWLEWPNGDYPEEIRGIDQDYFREIADTFMLKFGVES